MFFSSQSIINSKIKHFTNQSPYLFLFLFAFPIRFNRGLGKEETNGFGFLEGTI